MTVKELLEFLKTQPEYAKILIEDSNGAASFELEKEDVLPHWERVSSDGKEMESVVLFTKYKG